MDIHVSCVKMVITCFWVLVRINVLPALLLIQMVIAILAFILAKHVQVLEKICAIAVFQVTSISIINVKQIVMMEPISPMEAVSCVAVDVKLAQEHHPIVHLAMELNISSRILATIPALLQL